MSEDAAPVMVEGVSIDSRRVRRGDLFIALGGADSDGHDFVGAALEAGASAALVRRGTGVSDETPHLPVVEVDDPARALMKLAREERRNLSATVLGITGSTGKTCTKDLSAAVLRRRFAVVASPASFNNEVGLPLTLLSAGPDTEAVVCEMGSRGLGHIRLLCEVARPHLGVVTNVGVAHMELFGTPANLRDAKAELPEALDPDGTAVLNADDPVVRGFASRTAGRVVLFGAAGDAEVRAERVDLDATTGRAAFDLLLPSGRDRVALQVPGEHMVSNALAAAAVGHVLGMAGGEIAEALSKAEVSSGRMEVVERADGLRIIDDSYNANPTSMAAALRAARWMSEGGRCIAVLGHMAELGPIAAEEHERIGELVARLGIDELVVVGDEARLIAVAAEREGVEPGRITRCRGVADAVDAVRSLARPGDVVLVKASRVARLERLVEALGRGAAA